MSSTDVENNASIISSSHHSSPSSSNNENEIDSNVVNNIDQTINHASERLSSSELCTVRDNSVRVCLSVYQKEKFILYTSAIINLSE